MKEFKTSNGKRKSYIRDCKFSRFLFIVSFVSFSTLNNYFFWQPNFSFDPFHNCLYLSTANAYFRILNCKIYPFRLMSLKSVG